MPGDPTALLVGGGFGYPSAAGGSPKVAGAAVPSAGGGPGSFTFIAWLVLIGVVIPAVILGGLQVGGFSFVFRHR